MGDDQWVLLAYRLPRVPSTPRSIVWRKLKQLGVVQLGDGLVALPVDARTREAFEWIAEEIQDHDGEAMVWIGEPVDAAGRRTMRERLSAAIVAEYVAVTEQAHAAGAADPADVRRAVSRLRRELQRIAARDYISPPERESARRAVDALAQAHATVGP